MINKKKRYALLTLFAPLALVVLAIKILVAILTFTYIRLIHNGILMGRQMHKDLEFHEQGKVRR